MVCKGKVARSMGPTELREKGTRLRAVARRSCPTGLRLLSVMDDRRAWTAVVLAGGLFCCSIAVCSQQFGISDKEFKKGQAFLETLVPSGAWDKRTGYGEESDDIVLSFAIRSPYPARDVIDHVRKVLTASKYGRVRNPWNDGWCEAWIVDAYPDWEHPMRWWEHLFHSRRWECEFQWFEDWMSIRAPTKRFVSLHYEYYFVLPRGVRKAPSHPGTSVLRATLNLMPVEHRVEKHRPGKLGENLGATPLRTRMP